MKKVKYFFQNWISYLILTIILIAALYIRTYRIGDLLGFYYDQGRDALVIWKLWHEGKLFLIGPVTGLAGIFLGPFYYFLIAPLYLIGGGNPIIPSIFLSLLSVIALAVVYKMGVEMHSRTAGLIAATVGGFSYYMIYNSRWLSNPNPMFLISVIFLYFLWRIISGGKSLWWVMSAFVIGISLHFESASAFFYIFIFLIFSVWRLVKFRKLINPILFIKELGRNVNSQKKWTLFMILAFLITLMPQIIFNFKHENILLNNFLRLFTHDKAFSKPLTKFILETRIDYFWSAFMGKIFIGWNKHAVIFASLSLASLLSGKKKYRKGMLILFSIFLITPMVGYILFQGNFGNIYDYYLIGYFMPFILLYSIGLAEFSKTFIGKISLILFLIYFFRVNLIPIRGMMKNPMDGPTDIKFGSQLKAVSWVFENAVGRGVYNVDVYVPPVIPYAYDYLFLWQGTVKCGESLCGNVGYQTPVLYTLYEQDPPNPHRLEAWLEKQKGIGVVEEEAHFGGITVERRRRV
jgi:hypothetical protein